MKSARQIQLEAFLAEDPGDPFTHYALALEMLKNKNISEGLAKMEWLITNHPDYLATYYQLGKLYETTGEMQQALDIYRKGMQLAQLQKNNHAFGELKSAVEELE